MKCDLRVHSQHSGMCSTPLVGRICRESCSPPDRTYATLKKRGMDLVTLTDHDSIGAAESLRHLPDFFISEEVTCVMPSGSIAHIGIYDITAEFFEGIRAGEAVAAGGHGGYFKLTRDIFCITAGMMRERPWTALLAPLALLLPAATLAILAEEMAFAWYWNRQTGAPYRDRRHRARPRRASRGDWFRGARTSPEEVPIWP